MPRPDAHRDQDKADVFGVQDLCVALQVEQQVSQSGLEQEKWRAQVSKDLAAPGQTNQIIMLENTAVGLKVATWDEWEDEAFMPQADQLHQVTGLGMSRLGIPGHAAILPQRLHYLAHLAGRCGSHHLFLQAGKRAGRDPVSAC